MNETADPSLSETRQPPVVITPVPPSGRVRHELAGFYYIISIFLQSMVILGLWAIAVKLWDSTLQVVIGNMVMASAIMILTFAFKPGLGCWTRKVESWFDRRFGTDAQNEPVDPFERRLWQLWGRNRINTKSIAKAAHDMRPASCRIIVLGSVEPPTVGDRFFEQVIMTPMETHLHPMAWAPVVAWSTVMCFLFGVRAGPGRVAFTLAIGLAAVFIPAWIYYSVLCPTYARFAPGLIEFLRFPILRRDRPIISRFPMIEGTTVVVVSPSNCLGEWHDERWYRSFFRSGPREWPDPKHEDTFLTGRQCNLSAVYLIRDGQMETLHVTQNIGGKRRIEILEALWGAMLSTARIPKTSDTDLVG